MNQDHYEHVRVGDLGRVVTGRTPPTEVADYFGSVYPFVTPSDMNGQKTIHTAERSLSIRGAQLLKNNRLPAGSVAVSCIGWQMGKVAVIGQEAFTNQQINTIIPNGRVVPDYLYYLLSTKREELKNLGSVGTRTPILNKSAFEGIRLTLPPLPTQRKIAAVLSAYDDLIENNTRRIALLEETARALYREWFVEFRYPGHAGAPLVESPLGPIPQGWRVVPVGSVYLALYDGPHATPSPSAEGPVFLGIKNMTEDGHLNLDEVRHIAESDFPVWTRRVEPQPGDIVFTYEAALHRYAMIPQGFRGCLGRRVALIRPNCNKAAPHYLFRYFLSDRWRRTASQHVIPGATVDRISLIELPTFEMLLPPLDIQQRAEVVFGDYHRQIENYQATRDVLMRTRDLLLPKLVSGEVDVEGVEIEAPEEVEEEAER